MSDRELWEMAAKAAGMWGEAFEIEEDSDRPVFDAAKGFRLAFGRGWWNPLADDGDALRLAVKVGIAVYPPEADGDDATCNGPYPLSCWHSETVLNGDLYAATRRAIVRAAAAIGAAKEPT